MANTTENPNEETIKCVVVGDNNVGKTRLICARAYNEHRPNSRVLANTSHIPTVWAIDQYRINKEVLQNARCVIDGTLVSLRLWDTFGDHHKNRRFAYGKADVVVICFSICDEKSLRQVLRFWCPEVRKHCKNIPIILVGCKADLRFADLVKLNKTKGSLTRAIRHSDLLYPDKCRAVAAELNCPYYETSVLLGYGVHQVFENVCRAALIYRRSLYFWNARFKKIERPALQKPLEPPKPSPPSRKNDESSALLPKLLELYRHELLTDLTFFCQDRKIHAHKAVLGASSDFLFHLFLNEDSVSNQPSVESELDFDSDMCQSCSSSPAKSGPVSLTIKDLKTDSKETKTGKEPNDLMSFENCSTRLASNLGIVFVEKDEQGNSFYLFNFSFVVAQLLIDYCYTGELTQNNQTSLSAAILSELLEIAQLLGMSHLEKMVTATTSHDFEYAFALTQEFLCDRSRNIRRLCIEEHHFSDVVFHVDDGFVKGHKILLSSGCDMMNAMFAGRFIESENKEVFLPETTERCLRAAFEYIYLNSIHLDDDDDVCDLLALANRFCLKDFISYLENWIIDSLERREATYLKTTEVSVIKILCEEVVLLLETAQIHNAPTLAQWCYYFLTVYYNEACRHASKFMKHLPSDVQHYLEEHRWPPVWYIKQLDCYDRAVMERIESENKKVKRY